MKAPTTLGQPAGGDGAVCDRRARRLEDFGTRLSLFTGTICDLTRRIGHANDDLFGTEPENTADGEALDPAGGIYNDLDARLYVMDNALSRLSRQVDRLTENL